MRILFVLFLLLAAACQPPSDTRGMCQDLDVCESGGSVYSCRPLRIWYECDPEVLDRCEWQEFSASKSAPNEAAVPCEQCDADQCPEEE